MKKFFVIICAALLLAGCKAHCTAILSKADEQIFHDLKIDATSEAEFSTNNLYLG